MAQDAPLPYKETISLLNSILNDPAYTQEDMARRPAIPADLRTLCMQLFNVREFAYALSRGDLQHDCTEHGFTMGALKMLTANLRHLTWHLLNLAQGNYMEADPFMGEFSAAFNALSADVSKKSRELVSLIEEYKKLSYVDALTGLPNRRAFSEAGIREVQLAARTGRPLCLLIADVDFFKNINDTYGHKAGDIVLQALAKRFQAMLRKEDLCSRYGGEEFLFMLRETDLAEARDIAERLRRECAETPIAFEGHKEFIHISLGIARISPEELHAPILPQFILDQAIQRADKALYMAKESGRNRVCEAP